MLQSLSDSPALGADAATPSSIMCSDPASLPALNAELMSHAHAGSSQLSLGGLDWFTNWSNYVPRIHCMQRADGTPDWPWIIGTIALTTGVIVGYAKIMHFWLKNYFAEQKQDRNTKLFDLAQIFLWCAVCGYVMSILMFVWPAYRLAAITLVLLNVWTWKFALNLQDFQVSISAKRLQRELAEALRTRNAELERLVAERTTEAANAQALAEAANRTKSAFLANMSHEIRTPMTAILGFADMMNEPSQNESERRDCIATIQRNGRHLLSVINDILDISKIEAGRMSIELVPIDVGPLVRDAIELFRAKATSAGIDLRAQGLESLPPTIRTDPTRLRQVLLNLLGNAIKFTTKGEVVASVSFVEGVGSQPGTLTIAVRDTGIGMTSEQQSRIFAPFVQGDVSATRKFGGTGLGLSISKRLCASMGGSLTCVSTLGHGTTMTMSVAADAVHDAPSQMDDPASSSSPHLAYEWTPLNGRILFAEDGPDNRALISYHLRRAGAHVDLVEDGAQALAAIKHAANEQAPYDLAILDMHMPELDGYSTATRLREAGNSIPILALTAATMKGDREKCLAAGCNDYQMKPIDVRALLNSCFRLMARASEKAA